MSVDLSVIEAMRAAVAASPGNAALRAHLASLLLSAGQPAAALAEVTQVLAHLPDNLEALDIAARAAEATGQTDRALSFRRMHRALGGDVPPPVTPPTIAAPAHEEPPRLDLGGGGGAGTLGGFGIEGYDPTDAPRLRAGDGENVSNSDAKAYADERFEGEDPAITLSDVAGMEAVKRRLNVAFLGPMKNPELRAMYGKSLKGGLLLYGPPGCGKTFIARATAGELGARFISIGLADVLDMYIGQSERNLHEIFEQARRHRPCVLFFDEIDALGRKRSLRRESSTRDVVNQMLAEMDSVSADNEGIFILAATNHPWDVDTALRRPGRLDRTLLVLPPDQPARQAMLQSGMRGRPAENLDYGWIAGKTEDYSGADVVHLVESAAENALEESLATGKVRPIGMNDFKKALKEVRPSVRPWFDTARNYALFANEGGVYDELLEYLRNRKML